MRKNVIILFGALIFSVLTSTLFAQRQMNIREYEKRKMEYIKKEAGLTDEEARKYFPLNNELTQKKFELRKQYRDSNEKVNQRNMSEEEYRKLLDSDVTIKLKEAELDKEYSEKFEKVLSPQKLYKAQQAERNFVVDEVTKFRQDRGGRR